MTGIDEALKALPKGWRFQVGHVPHWYRRDALPKHLRKKPFEAYVVNPEPIGTRLHVFESADGATPAEALNTAIAAGNAAFAALLEKEG